MPLLLLTLLVADLGGVSFATNNFELVKRIGAQRSVIHSGEAESREDADRRAGEVRAGLESLGAGLDELIQELRGAENPYPLLRGVLRDYRYLRPVEQSPEDGRMYVMYTGELHWRFPAPLLADLLRLRVAHSFPQPHKDLLTTVLMRWGRDHIEGPSRASPSVQREQIAGWIDDLSSAEVMRVSWRHDRVVKQLKLAPLTRSHVASLEKVARSGDPRARVAALRVLGAGGHVDDPSFYARLLADASTEVQHAAFWALVFMPGERALPHLQRYAGRAQAIGARLEEVRAGVTPELVAEQVDAFDRAVAAITGVPAVEAVPYETRMSPAELLEQAMRDREAPEAVEEEKVPAPLPPVPAPPPAPPERKPVTPAAPSGSDSTSGSGDFPE